MDAKKPVPFAEVLDSVARRYGQRPSKLMGIIDPFLALIYDIDIAVVGTKAEAEAIRTVEFHRNTKAATLETKAKKMRDYLDTLPEDSPVRKQLDILRTRDGGSVQ